MAQTERSYMEGMFKDMEAVERMTGIPQFEYKTVDTTTVKGVEESERLVEEGWKIVSSSLWRIQFQREKK